MIQVRDVPDEVHEALQAAARARGQSLTRFVLTELEQLARRSRSVEHNAEVIRRAQVAVGGAVSREDVLTALRESRGE